MPHKHNPRSDRWESALVIAAVVAPLLLVLGMFAHARRTEHLRQQTVDSAFRDYAALAAWQLASRLDEAFHQAVMDQVGRPSANGSASRATGNGRHSQDARCDCAPSLPPAAFRYEPSTRSLTWLTERPDSLNDAELAALVGEEIGSPVAGADREEPHRAIFASLSGKPAVIGLTISRSGDRAASGVVSGVEPYLEEIRNLLARRELLPSAIVKPPYGPDKLFVSITRRDGERVFENAPIASAGLAASQQTKPIWGSLAVTVQLNPAMADALRLGAANRLTPAFLLLIVVSALLAWAAIWQLKRSRELSRSRAQFVANVSHELRTPLAHISMFAETIALARERSPDERRHFASVIHRETLRLSGLVDRVLTFARGESGLSALHCEVRPLHRDIEAAVTLFAPIAHTSGSVIDFDLDTSLRAIVDEGAMRQILLNFLDNAVKYGPEGQRIDVRLTRVGDEAVITVDDAGPGIATEQRARVFDPFVRLEHTRNVSGTGIGLAVVRELVVAQRGRVWIDDAPGGGARLCVAFPVASSQARLETPGKREPSLSGTLT